MQTLTGIDLCPYLPSSSELQNKASTNDTEPLLKAADRLFTIQAAHARCCALLRLAEQEGLWQQHHAPAVPWLDAKAALRLRQPAEQQLIGLLVAVLDEWTDAEAAPSLAAGLGWGAQLSFGFQQFDAACRIWGDVRTEQPLLAQARLGLVRATRAVLRLVLCEWLQTDAPSEL